MEKIRPSHRSVCCLPVWLTMGVCTYPLLGWASRQSGIRVREGGLPSWTACTSAPLSESDWPFPRFDRSFVRSATTTATTMAVMQRARKISSPLPIRRLRLRLRRRARPSVRRSLQVLRSAQVQNIPGSMAAQPDAAVTECSALRLRVSPTSHPCTIDGGKDCLFPVESPHIRKTGTPWIGLIWFGSYHVAPRG